MGWLISFLIVVLAISNVIWILECVSIGKAKKRLESLSDQALDSARRTLNHNRILLQRWNDTIEKTWRVKDLPATMRQDSNGLCVVINGIIIRKFEFDALTKAKDLCRALNRMDGVISSTEFIDIDEPWRLERCKDCMHVGTDFCNCHDKRGRSPQANA